MCVDVVALKSRCTVWRLSPAIHKWCFTKIMQQTKSSACFSWLNQRHKFGWLGSSLCSCMKDKWHCWLCGRPQSVITCKNTLQGVSVTSVFTAHCSPAHILLQVKCLGFCILTSRWQISLYTQRIVLKPERTQTINQMGHSSSPVVWLTVAQPNYSVWIFHYQDMSSSDAVVLYLCTTFLKHNNGMLMCMWTYLVIFSGWNPIKSPKSRSTCKLFSLNFQQ